MSTDVPVQAKPGEPVHIYVRWHDGLDSTWDDYEWEVNDGMLWLINDKLKPGAICIPLANVRLWTVS